MQYQAAIEVLKSATEVLGLVTLNHRLAPVVHLDKVEVMTALTADHRVNPFAMYRIHTLDSHPGVVYIS